jgi:hypothetical protein
MGERDMKIKIFAVVVAAVLAALVPSVARAQCAGTEVTLDNTNVTGFGVTVTLCVTGNTVTLEDITNDQGLSVVGLDALGTPNNVTLSSYSDPGGSTWSNKNNPPNQMDGFGSFYEIVGVGPASTCGSTSNPDCWWTFSGAPGTSGYAVHVRFSNGCSAFVSDLTTTSAGPDTNCVAPEPSELSMLVSGLFGIAGLFFFRRRLPMPSASA